MKHILTASFLLISSFGITQQFIDRNHAIQLAIDYGITELIDFFESLKSRVRFAGITGYKKPHKL